MIDISLKRLRRVCDDAEAAHAALMRTTDRVRAARSDLRAAERHRDDVARNAFSDEESDQRAGAAVKEAEAAYRAALEAQERAHEVWELAAALRTKVKAYAKEQGVLPADLEEH